jgi:hypothetical protein
MMALGRRVKPLDIGAVTGWARYGDVGTVPAQEC